MNNSEIIKILRTFSGDEVIEFRKFLKSDFFNKNEKVRELFEVLIKYHPGFESSNLTREKIFKKLYPSAKYNSGTLYMLSHYLNKVLDKFLAYKNVMVNDSVISLRVLEEKYKRGLHDNIIEKFKKLNGEIEKEELELDDYNYYKFKLNRYLMLLNYKDIKKSHYDVIKVLDPLIKYYYFSFFGLFIRASNFAEIFNYEHNLKAMRDVFAGVDLKYVKQDPLLEIYYNIALLFLYPEDESIFDGLRKLVSVNRERIAINDLNFIYRNMKNYCIRKTWRGNDFISREFSIIKEQISDPRFGSHSLTPFFYLNAAKVSLSLENYKWGLEFIKTYKKFLVQPFRDDYFNLAMGYWCNATGKYGRSLEHISKVKSGNIFLKLDLKFLESINYYKLNWFDTLYSELDSYYHLIKNDNKLTGERKRAFLRYVKYAKKLVAINEKFINFDKAKRETELTMLKSSIENVPKMTGKQWLLEEIDILLNN